MNQARTRQWSTEQSRDLYGLPAWAEGLFDVSIAGLLSASGINIITVFSK